MNSDLDRIPQLAWLLFLKAFDDAEQRRGVTERRYEPAISAPYRWRDWAADPINGRTGQELLRFVNEKLLPYLRRLRGTGKRDPKDVLAAVFKETSNRMLSGYLLRDVVNLVHQIDFGSTDDIHTMAVLYESMLREMRDAAGDAGEFYTPRPVIRFIVRHAGLRVGDSVLDPAVGTGGFLVEALELLRPQLSTASHWRALQDQLMGIEKKPMPFLLGVMNLLLHGVDRPNVRRDNALGHPLSQLSASAKVDVVVTNPPFGGEEEREVPANFPAATRTAETALLFLQFIQRSLKPGGRCGLVVPNSVLFGGGVAARVKEQLLRECNVHTIVRLPAGVFEPYTDVPTSLMFFEKTGPTSEIWFYENPLPVGRKTYTKSNPLQYDEFSDCDEWWGGVGRERRVENERAWRVSIADVEARGYDLDLHSPHPTAPIMVRPTVDLLNDLAARAGDLQQLIDEIRNSVGPTREVAAYPLRPLHELMKLDIDETVVEPEATYNVAGIYSFGKGLFKRASIQGSDTKYSSLHRLHADQFVFSRLGAWEGAVAIVPTEFENWFASQEYPTFTIDTNELEPTYLACICHWPQFWDRLITRGSMKRRKRSHPTRVLEVMIPVPPPPVQRRFAETQQRVQALLASTLAAKGLGEALSQALLHGVLTEQDRVGD